MTEIETSPRDRDVLFDIAKKVHTLIVNELENDKVIIEKSGVVNAQICILRGMLLNVFQVLLKNTNADDYNQAATNFLEDFKEKFAALR